MYVLENVRRVQALATERRLLGWPNPAFLSSLLERLGFMKLFLKQSMVVLALGLSTATVAASGRDLTIHLKGSEPITRQSVTFQCDLEGVTLGLPAGPFSVEYINGAGNSLAILPISGKSLIFANVMAASGARYAAGSYIWWDAGTRGTTLYSDSLAGKDQSSCQRMDTK